MAEEKTEEKYQFTNEKKMLVFIRYKPTAMPAEGGMLGGISDKVSGIMDKVESVANAIPGLNFKEETDPEKANDKEYKYFKDYGDWDKYIDKMKDELPDRIGNEDNQAICFDFDADDVEKRKSEGKKIAGQLKSKIADWKDYTAGFYFVGIGQGGNVVNECINEIGQEADFKKKWKVKSAMYVGSPLYRFQNKLKDEELFEKKIDKTYFNNSYDLTTQAIEYFEPYDKLLKLIQESNSNTVSIFTGKIAAQVATTLGRLASIQGFGTGHDNKGNIDKMKQVEDDVKNLMEDLKTPVKDLLNAFPELWDLDDLPEFKKIFDGWDGITNESVDRLKEFAESLKDVHKGASLDTERIGLNKFFNFLCPLVDRLANSFKTLSPGGETANKVFDKLIEKAGVEKIFSPEINSGKQLPVDPYIEKVVEMAKKANEAENNSSGEAGMSEKTKEQVFYDQSVSMINKCKGNIKELTKEKDIKLKDGDLSDEQKAIAGEAFASLLLPMMPSKAKFYGALLKWLPFDGAGPFMERLTANAAFAPIKGLMSKLQGGFDFDEGTPEKPGLKKSLANLDAELSRIKGYLNKNNFPVHKDANSLYFIYNSNNILLSKPWGEVQKAIEEKTGYYAAMKTQGFNNTVTLEESKYEGGGAQNQNVQHSEKYVEEEKK
ncbi:MAG: hypothetical protein ACK5NK_16325 [Niabella sp.]